MAPVAAEPAAPAPASPPSVLEAGPVTLQAFRAGDGPALNRLVVANLEHLRPWMPWAQEVPTEAANADYVRRSLEDWERGTAFGYWLRETPSGDMVGCAGLHARVGPSGLEIGYWVSADRVRRGYATAAARALTTAAFELPGVERVEIHCDVANVASAAVPRRLGYRLERLDDVPARAPSETGSHQVWVADRASWLTASS